MLQNDYNIDETIASQNFARLIVSYGHNYTSMANIVGRSPSYIRKLANENEPFNPTIDTLIHISNGLGISLAELIDFLFFSDYSCKSGTETYSLSPCDPS